MYGEFFVKCFVGFIVVFDGDEGVYGLVGKFVGNVDDGGFSNGMVFD